MSSHRIACGKVMKFGTQIEDSLLINHSKFWISNTNSLVPPIGQISAHVSANNFWTIRSKIKYIFFPLNAWLMLSRMHTKIKCLSQYFSQFRIFPNNLLFRTHPRRFVQFLPKWAQIICWLFWQKVNKSVLIYQTIFIKHDKKMDKVWAKMDKRQKNYISA